MSRFLIEIVDTAALISVAVSTLCFDLSNEASEPKGVCSCKNYLKTCQDATTRAWVPRLFLCWLFRLPVCF